jgi:hypothetical protein
MAEVIVIIVSMIAWTQVAIIGAFLVVAGASPTERTGTTSPYQPMQILAARAKAKAAAAAADAVEHPAAA